MTVEWWNRMLPTALGSHPLAVLNCSQSFMSAITNNAKLTLVNVSGLKKVKNMKTKNHQSTNAKEPRLAQALVLASSHQGCTAAAIQRNEIKTWGAMEIFDIRLIIDIFEKDDCDVFRVHGMEWLPMPSAATASAIANHANSLLAVAKVVVEDGRLGIFAHEFIPKDGIPSEINLKRLVDDVLVGIVLILKQLKELEKMSALLKGLPHSADPVLN
jgi:hypothetical protein